MGQGWIRWGLAFRVWSQWILGTPNVETIPDNPGESQKFMDFLQAVISTHFDPNGYWQAGNMKILLLHQYGTESIKPSKQFQRLTSSVVVWISTNTWIFPGLAQCPARSARPARLCPTMASYQLQGPTRDEHRHIDPSPAWSGDHPPLWIPEKNLGCQVTDLHWGLWTKPHRNTVFTNPDSSNAFLSRCNHTRNVIVWMAFGGSRMTYSLYYGSDRFRDVPMGPGHGIVIPPWMDSMDQATAKTVWNELLGSTWCLLVVTCWQHLWGLSKTLRSVVSSWKQAVKWWIWGGPFFGHLPYVHFCDVGKNPIDVQWYWSVSHVCWLNHHHGSFLHGKSPCSVGNLSSVFDVPRFAPRPASFWGIK